MPWKPSQVWTNFSQVHVIFGEIEDANQLLLEASEINPECWEVWRDLVIISAEYNNFDTFISAYLRLLEINKNYRNEPLLTKFVYSIIELAKKGHIGNNIKLIIKKAIHLLTTITRLQTKNPTIWTLIALLAAYSGEDKEISQITNYINQALAATDPDAFWFRSHAKVMRKIFEAKTIVSTMVEIYNHMRTPESCKILSRGKCEVETIVLALYENYRDPILGRVRKQVEEDVHALESLKAYIDKIIPARS